MNYSILIIFIFTFGLVGKDIEPTNAKEAQTKKAKAAADLVQRFQAWKAKLSPEQQKWESVLESELGGFYLPRYQQAKLDGKVTAWDYIKPEEGLPNVLLIGDSVSRGYTLATREKLKGVANLYRAPANCGPTATGLNKLDVWLGDKKWDLIHVNFGIHDRKTKLKDYRERLTELIQRLKATKAHIIWASTTPLPKVWKADPKVKQESIVERNLVAKEIMLQHQIPINDLYHVLLPYQAELQNENDCHFNGKGYEFLGKQVASTIEDTLSAASKTAQLKDSYKSPFSYSDDQPKRYSFKTRASEITPGIQEHPEVNYLFKDTVKGKEKILDYQHGVVDTSVAPRGKLVIWLMGHNAGLFERLADYGLHAIQVHYANRWFGKYIKLRPEGQRIYLGNIRLEAATGKDIIDAVNIPYTDGMKNKAVQMVKWLQQQNPQANWQYFLTENGKDLKWEEVTIAGISHGATTSARFALHQKVGRVVMLSGPRDQNEDWQALPSATPKNRFFAFTHVLDGGWPGNHYPRSWDLLDLDEQGAIVNVDATPYPYNHSRRLISDADVKGSAGRAHTMVQPGGSAVKDENGKYIHEKVWKYLFTHPVELNGSK